MNSWIPVFSNGTINAWAVSCPSEHLYVHVLEPLFSYPCSVSGSWILLAKSGVLSRKRSLIKGRSICCRMSMYFIFFSMPSVTWRRPRAFVNIHTDIITLVGFFIVAWMQSGCISSPMRFSYILRHRYQILISLFRHSISLVLTDLLSIKCVIFPLYSILPLLFIQ